MKSALVAILAISLCGCTTNLNSKLGTKKNPHLPLDRPEEENSRSRKEGDNSGINPFVYANFRLLSDAVSEDGLRRSDVQVAEMAPYLTSGFALTDYYCEQFFLDADESQRRRRFGRALTNDVGTAVSTVLGLANAGQNVVTGAAASFGLGDNLWRNYDDAFVVAPDLSNVKVLVYAAQDNFRQKTFSEALPKEFGTAQTVILRYAHLCSTLGMRSLLSQAATEQKNALNAETQSVKKGENTEAAVPQAAMQAVPQAAPSIPKN